MIKCEFLFVVLSIAALLFWSAQPAQAGWVADGTALCTTAGSQTRPTIASDGSGGAIVTWQDYRSGSGTDIYAQRVTYDGKVLGNLVPISIIAVVLIAPAIGSLGLFRLGRREVMSA